MSGCSLTVDQYLSLVCSGTNIFTVKIPRTNTSGYGFLSDSDITNGSYKGTAVPTTYSTAWQGLYLDTNITIGASVAMATMSGNYGVQVQTVKAILLPMEIN